MSTEERPLPRLPACSSCYHRKAKCDSKRPKCDPCAKNGQECVVLSLDGGDGNGHVTITRQEIHELEGKKRRLSMERVVLRSEEALSIDHPTSQSITATDGTARSVERSNNFVNGAGLSFLTSLFMDQEWRENNADLLQTLAKTSEAAESTVQPNPLPSSAEARFLFDKYLATTQIQAPFLLKDVIEDLYTRVYTLNPRPQTKSHDLFRVYIISAIGSVLPHRSGSYDAHPFGYFLAAMQHFNHEFLSGGVCSIQDLQLIGRFGIYHHIGISIWDITQLCIRICIEHGFHLQPTCKMTLIEEHLQRRLFWQCYIIDRYSSTTLDRPCAIAERDIHVGFLVDANDNDIIASNEMYPNLDSYSAAHVAQGNTEMSVFIQCLRLRQITSLIQSKFSHTSTSSSSYSTAQQNLLMTGRIYSDLEIIFGKLQEWRNLAPVLDNPNCLYETQEWFDHLLARERLLLIRKAIDLSPKRNGVPPKDLLILCLEAGILSITLFSSQFLKGKITYTRSYFQMMFTAGLSVMFCISATADLEPSAILKAILALDHCERTIRHMGIHLPDAQHYATVFEALVRNVKRKRDRDSIPNSVPPYQTVPGELSGISNERPKVGPLFSSLPIDPDMQGQEVSNQQSTISMHSHNPNPHLLDYESTGSGLAWNSSLASDQPVPGTANGWGFDDDALHWAFMNDNTLWNMEVGLGEYAYGERNSNTNIFEGLGLNI